MSEDGIIGIADKRSGRGKAESAAADKAARDQADALAAQRAAFMGPKMTLEFPNEYMHDLWRSGILNDGRRQLADRILHVIGNKTADEFKQLVIDLGTLTGGPVDNLTAYENCVRRFLGLPDAEPRA